MTTEYTPLDTLDAKGFLNDFHHTTIYGATPRNGIDRQAGTAEHGAVRAWFRERARALGFDIRIDSIGNQFATYTFHEGAPFVWVGSHLDSQPLGGRFDGTYGVIAALHAAARIVEQVAAGDRPTPALNIAVVDWFNEEGARFAPSLMGSGTLVGTFDRDEMWAVTDDKGITVKEALESIGCLGTDAPPEVAAYAEIHIEQGRILERESVKIGVVDQSWYTQKLLVKVIGEQSHTGATIMADRHDALPAAAEIILATEQVVENFDPEQIVTSIGKIAVQPNSPIVVPRQVDMTIDLRADLKEDVLEARRILKEKMAEIAQRRNLTIEATDFDIRDIQHYPVEGQELTEKAAADAGISHMRMRTMAGHDSVAMNRIVPAVMIFIPSEGGVSHCEREFTSDEDMVAGVDVFTYVLGRMVDGELDGVEPGESL